MALDASYEITYSPIEATATVTQASIEATVTIPQGVPGPPGPPGTAVLLEALAPLPDGLNVIFLASAAIVGEMVLINGIAQQPVAHYLIDGLEVHFDDPPEVGDILQILRTS